RAAVRDVKRFLQAMKAKTEDRAGLDEARIFDAQILMLEDKEFLAAVANLIRENHLTAEKAYEFKTLEVRDMWAATGSPRLKDRLADLTGVAVRVIEHLMHRGSDELWEGITQPSVVVAKELSPALTVELDREHVVGLVSEEGTRTSHAAILAHSIGIPAVFGVAGAIERIEPGTMLVMDGTRGTVLLDPTPHEIAEARALEQRRRELASQLEEVVDLPAVTVDGLRIVLRGNVDLPDEIGAAGRQARRRVADGAARHPSRGAGPHACPRSRRSHPPRSGGRPRGDLVARGRDGRDARRRRHRGPARRRGGLPVRRHERPDAIHARRGSGQRPARRPIHAARPERVASPEASRRRRARGGKTGERVRGNGVRAAVGVPADRTRIRDPLRSAAGVAAREVDRAAGERGARPRGRRGGARRAHRGRCP